MLHSAHVERRVVVIDVRGPYVALARRIERSPPGQNSADTIFAELADLALRFPEMAKTTGAFSCGWSGYIAEYANGQPMIAVRTFIPDASALAA
jgi:hypothetical protein